VTLWADTVTSSGQFERRLAARRLDCPFIFHRNGGVLSAKRVRPFFYAALKTCGFEAGRAGFTLYDTKKTAAGLLIDPGLTEREAMHVSGHKTPSMFDRYIVKSADRHREQVRKRDAYLQLRLARPLSNVLDPLSRREGHAASVHLRR
jgi:hypothetical protein